MSFSQEALDDRDLVSRCLAGEPEAFEPLVTRYHRLLFTIALRMIGDEEEAKDAVQNAFLRAYRHLASYEPDHKFFSWIYRILVNECLNVRRARRGREPLDPATPGGDDPAERLRRVELRARVQAALLELRERDRQVVVLRHFGDLSYEEIAETIGVPVKTVKSRLYAARQRLGRQLLGWKNAS